MFACQDLKPEPSKFKAKFASHGIPLSHAAHYFDFNVPYFCNLINGVSKMSPEIEKKLQSFFDHLEGR